MNKLLTFFFLSISVFLLGLSGAVFASTTDGTASGYAWADQIGWINFETTYGNVHITDSALTGYLWNENYGWINLSPSTSGVTNNNEGTLSGYAWGESTGWINFNGVTINSSGEFTGAATGDIVGTISFTCSNCGVTTDWRPRSTRPTGGGALPSGAYNPPAPPFSISINNGTAITNSQIVTLKFSAGTDTKKIAISNDPNFTNAVQEDFQPTKMWDLCKGREDVCRNLSQATGSAFKVYAKFYTQYGQTSEPIQSSIIFDNQLPAVEITNIKASYGSNEDIIVSGNCEPNSELALYWADQYGVGHADSQGNWSINLGRLPAGKYQLEIIPKDSVGNIGKSITTDLIIGGEVTPPVVSKIIDQLKIVFQPLIPQIFLPPTPEIIVTVPKEAPLSLEGKWNILPQKQLESFVLEPLPREIQALAHKFPQLEKTFEEVGITKATEVEKLKNVKITLPGLSEVIGWPGLEIEPGKMTLPKGVPLSHLTSQAKALIPTEIVFARAAGELVDYKISLSLSEQGKPLQTIRTLANQYLYLSVKPEGPVRKVMGYIVLKSREAQPTSFQFPLESLSASLVFSQPDLAQPQTKPVEIENKLVLMEFEYTDPDKDGIYTATIQAPAVDAEYEIITVIDYVDIKIGTKEIRMTTVVDPEGYVYEKNGDKETRINGAIVSLYWLNPETKQYELWPAKDYQQDNPQTTNVSGNYAFLVPEGYYYLKVDTPGYLSYDGKAIEVKEGSGIHVNIELKTKYWWLRLVDWKTIALVLVVLLLLFNFYRDFKRKQN